MKKPVRIIVVLLLLLLILGCLGESRPGLFFMTLLLGWIRYLIRVVPQVHWNFGMIGMWLFCLAGTIGVGHVMLSWLVRNWGDAGHQWRFRNTLVAVVGVVTLFCAGMAATGIVHQSVWLGKENWFYLGFRNADKLRCVSHLRQIGQAVTVYADANNGLLPPSLASLCADENFNPQFLCCPASDNFVEGNTNAQRKANFDSAKHVTYLFQHAGEELKSIASNEILVYETLKNHDGQGISVLYANGEAEWLEKSKAITVLQSIPSP